MNTSASARPAVSIITPAYNEAGNLRAMHKRLIDALAPVTGGWEWIVVDDSSSDGTFEVAEELAKSDSRVRCVRFSRNFGSHMAILCGISRAKGDCGVVLAGDLQDPPETIPELLAKWRAGAKVVWAVRAMREGENASKLAFSKIYWWILRNVVGMKEVPPNGADFFLLDRIVIDALASYNENNMQIMALITWMGFKQDSIYYQKQARASGTSGWSFQKKVKLAVDSVISFSYLPVRLMSYTGFIMAFTGFIFAFYVLLNAVLSKKAPEGWSSLMTGIVVIGGVQMLMMGVLGEYIWRALDESRRRPRYLVEKDTSASSGVKES